MPRQKLHASFSRLRGGGAEKALRRPHEKEGDWI